MMKRRVIVSVLLLALLLAGLGGQAFADGSYQVRLYGGNSDVGVLDQEKAEFVPYTKNAGTYQYGSYSFDASRVTIKDDRYYVKGFREAGKDNSNGFYTNAYNNVERDMDFVVSYGMKGSAVEYTVNFVDEEGKALEASQTFYANIGDKPVVSYVYIEGYQPQAYALTKTLSSNAGDNVFTFTYVPATPVTTTTVVPGGAPVIPVGNAGAGNAGNAGGNAGNAGGQPAQPETIIDLDVPLAAPDDVTTEPGTEGTEKPGKPEDKPTGEPEKPKDTKLASWIPYVLAVGGVGLLSAFLVALRKRRAPGKELTVEDFDEALKEAKEKTDEHADKK